MKTLSLVLPLGAPARALAWCSRLVLLLGACSRLVLPLGAPAWCSHLVLPLGAPSWCSHLVLPLGAPAWWSCLVPPLGAPAWCPLLVPPLASCQDPAFMQAPHAKAPLACKRGLGARRLRARGGLARGACREAGRWRFLLLLGVTLHRCHWTKERGVY